MSKGLSIPNALCAAQDGLCFYCGVEFTGRKLNGDKARPSQWSVDHLLPSSAGHARSKNSVLACNNCNISKKNIPATDEQLRRAQIIHAAAMRLMLAFNGHVPAEWV